VLASVMAAPLERLAPGTITDPDELEHEVAHIREQGWAASREETNAGAWGVAAPVLSREGTALAVIGMAAPLSRHSTAAEATARAAVLSAAAESARDLGVNTRGQTPVLRTP
jgi:DNA-binding IclR family transcriptional regulator